MTSFTTHPWHALPAEMQLAVVEQLALHHVRAFATTNKHSYALSVPLLWRNVHLKNADALLTYMTTVPATYQRYIRHLSISTSSVPGSTPRADIPLISNAIAALLSQCSQLEHLELKLETALHASAIAPFQNLVSLKSLTISHCGDEHKQPLSERLVVSMAATVPNLAELSLSCIARSVIHAQELVGAYPFVPVVVGDEDIPDHPLLGSELSLPSLLRLSTLKTLRIRDTHLGDPRWSDVPVCCSLQVLDLGICYHESPDFNRICTERIIGNVGHTVDEFSLATAITADCLAPTNTEQKPLKRLRKIHLTPLFPVENVVDTLSTLSDSPIEQLSVRCHEDDVVDMCSALEDFLNSRVERGQTALFEHLTAITVDTVADLDDQLAAKTVVSISADRADAVIRLQEYCRDLHLATSPISKCVVATSSDSVAPTTAQGKSESSFVQPRTTTSSLSL